MSSIIFDETENGVERLKDEIERSDKIIIGAGAGLSTSAGFTYSGERFYKYFSDFIAKYHFRDMYSAGFYPYETSEELWAFWSRYIFINRYMNPPKDTYNKLFEIVKNKDYFVLTTNVDHMFQKPNFSKERLFYTQGDYGLFQCQSPCHKATYDNETIVRDMLESQNIKIENGDLTFNDDTTMRIDSALIPHCPKCGKEMTMNLRSDDKFVEDSLWYDAEERFEEFQKSAKNKKILYLELGVGANTPGIIKYPFMRSVYSNKKAVYATINYNEAYTLSDIASRSIVINSDIDEVLERLIAL